MNSSTSKSSSRSCPKIPENIKCQQSIELENKNDVCGNAPFEDAAVEDGDAEEESFNVLGAYVDGIVNTILSKSTRIQEIVR